MARPKKTEKKRDRLQVMVDVKVIEKIDELAGVIGKSRNDMTELLLETALEDNELLIRVVKRIKDGVDSVWGKLQKQKKLQGT